jgi:hypothetical protein
MATTKIKIAFGPLMCPRDSNTWGTHAWSVTATVGDKAVSAMANNVTAGKVLSLPAADWTFEIDVSAKKPGETVVATLKVVDKAVTGDVDLGTVTATFNHPFEQEMSRYFLAPPKAASDGTFNHFRVSIAMTVSAFVGPNFTPPAAAPLGKKGAGKTKNTVTNNAPTRRVEICPVIPVLRPEQMPPRPAMNQKIKVGKDTIHAKAVPLTGNLPLNALANPSLIPILDKSNPNFASLAARIAITYLRPHDLDISEFLWVVKSGPVKFDGPIKGTLSVLAYATGESSAPAESELRDKSTNGPLLAQFRAWVGKVKHIPLRSTIIVGDGVGATPRVTPAHVQTHINLANVLMYQAGLLFIPDPVPTAWDGAVYNPLFPGIYVINTKTNALTVGVAKNAPPPPLKLNFRAGAMHLCYVKSLAGDAAGVATDRPGLSGANVTLDGTPSTSWLPPSGIAPDGAAGNVTMLTMNASNARSSKADLDYIKLRQKIDPGLTNDSYKKLFGCIMPDYTQPSDPDWPQTIAHEIGHVMGLRHRGNPQTDPQSGQLGGQDSINGAGGWGHPFEENVMSYGYTLSQDFDLIQTKYIRTHASVIDPGPGPKPEPPPVKTPLQELQEALGVTVTDKWDDDTEAAAKKKMVKWGSTGDVVTWVQKRLTNLGFECGPIDGKSGSKTTGGIRAYQNANPPLVADSTAGPRTLQSLAEA